MFTDRNAIRYSHQDKKISDGRVVSFGPYESRSLLLKSLRNEKCYGDNPRKDEAHPNEIVHYVRFNHSLVLPVTNYVRKNPLVKNADLPQEDPSTLGSIAEIPRVGGSIPPPGTKL